MNLRRLLAVSRKEVLQLYRDRRSMTLAFLLPLLLLLLFGYAISWDVRDIPTAVWDADGTPASRELLAASAMRSRARGVVRVTSTTRKPPAMAASSARRATSASLLRRIAEARSRPSRSTKL